MHPLISTETLAAELGSSGLVVLDATVYMPGDKREARSQFAAARVPGARFFAIDQIVDRHSPLPHMVPSAQHFA